MIDPEYYYIMALFGGTGVLSLIFHRLRTRNHKKVLSKKAKRELVT